MRRRVWPVLRAIAISVVLAGGLADGIADDAFVGRRNKASLAIRAPLRKLFGFIGTDFAVTQRWALFPSARRERHWMWIEARRGPFAQWELVYRPHDDAHALFADKLEYRRLRGAWNPSAKQARGGYPYFVTWIARMIFAREPTFTEVRVRMEVIDLRVDRGEVRGTGKFDFQEIRRRGEVGP